MMSSVTGTACNDSHVCLGAAAAAAAAAANDDDDDDDDNDNDDDDGGGGGGGVGDAVDAASEAKVRWRGPEGDDV